MSNPALWHPDPLERHELRYWDGSKWTEHVADAGVTAVDPVDGDGAGDGANNVAASEIAPPSPVQATKPTVQLDQALAAVTQQATNRISTSALIVGIIALVMSVIPLVGAFAGFPLGGYALVAGIIGLLIAKKSGRGRGASIAGIVLGGLALALAIFQVVVLGRIADGYLWMM